MVKSRSESRFSSFPLQGNLLSDLLLTYFGNLAETYFWATFRLLYFFGDFWPCGSPGTSQLGANLASRWEGVRLPRASGKSPDFPGSSPNFPRCFSATSPEVLSLWNFTAIQGFPGSFPDFPGSSPELPRKFPGLPRRSAPLSGEPDTLSWLAKTSSEFKNPFPSNREFLARNWSFQ